MIVELVGIPGAGKSVLQAAVVEELRAGGLAAMAADAAVLELLDRSSAARFLRPATRGAPARLRTVAVDGLGWLAVGFTRPRLAWRALRTILRSPVSPGHRALLARRFATAAARERFVRRHLQPGEAVVIDEGLLHRTVNLFAWRMDAPPAEIRRYVDGVPALPDIVLLLEASPATVRQRLAQRGLPARLRGRSTEFVDAFLTRSAQALEVATHEAARRGSTVLRVATDGTVDEAERRLRSAVHTAVADRAGRTWTPRFRSGLPISVRRPDRVVAARRSARRPISMPLEPVLSELGVAAAGPARRLASGRSDVVSLATDRGTIIIKRYRASVDDPAIAGEHSVLLELGRRCFPAPRLVFGPSGETLVRHAGERYAAFEALEGYQPAHALLSLPGAARRLARDAGRSLAALHSALDRFAPSGTNPDGLSWPDGGRVRPVDWYLERLSAATGGRGLDPDEQRRAGERLAALETELPARLPRRAVIHGDYGPYNLLVRPGEPLVVTDFELARLDWSLTDLATALPRFAANRFGLSHRRALAFLDGYTAVIPLSEEERRLIPQVLEYLSLRRVAVCVGRWMSTGEQRWLDEAVAKVRQARMLRDGRHPLARLLD